MLFLNKTKRKTRNKLILMERAMQLNKPTYFMYSFKVNEGLQEECTFCTSVICSLSWSKRWFKPYPELIH